MKNVTEYVVLYRGHFWCDREDIETGDDIVSPGDKVFFTYKGKKYNAEVTDIARGRDDDVYGLIILS